MINRAERDAMVAMEQAQKMALAQVETAAQAAHLALLWYAQLQAAVAESGEIGSVWAGAQDEYNVYVQILGQTLPAMQAALSGVITAAQAMHAAGIPAGLNLLPGAPGVTVQ